MAKLTRAAQREMSPPRITEEYPLAVAGTVYDGAIMCFDANGKLAEPAGGLIFAGITMLDTMEEDAQVDDPIRVAADMLVWLPLPGSSQDQVGERVWATDNGTLQTTSANARKSIGLIRAWRPGEVKVDTSKAEVA